MTYISVIIPVYKAENCLDELYSRLKVALEIITMDFEIIFVEDCGGDRSWEIISKLAVDDDRVRGFKLSRNFGQHAATICGISKAVGRWIVTIDDDLEQRPEDISRLNEKALEGYDLVYGVYDERTHSTWRNLTSKLARRLFKIAVPSLNYDYTSFRIFRNEIGKAITSFDSPFPFIDGYLSWITNNYSTVNVNHCQRIHGISNYNLKKLLTHTVNIFVTFSDLPLKISSWLGLTSFGVGLLWLVIILLTKLWGGITVSGYSSIMASIITFGGMQMFVLGIFGEYLGRINFKTSKKPLFLISKETKASKLKNQKMQ